MQQINNFDEYCRALKSGGELFERARLIHFLRSWLIAVQNLDEAQDAEKLNYVGLTEILSLPPPEPCDEVARIARASLNAMRYISANFREKILHENVMMPTYRAKEIDSAGLNWLSKRSGRTIREKLSSTNSLLAVQRRMSLDTGENRLFLAFVRQLEEYIEQKRLTKSGVVAEIERDFQESALKILHGEEIEDIGRWENLPPNNTLLSDRFYRQIWRSWLDLQNVSELIAEDSRNLGERLCTVYFWHLLRAASGYRRFSQQPVEYDYAKFELTPWHEKIVGYSKRGVSTFLKLGERIQIDAGYEIIFEDTTAIFRRGDEELQRQDITVANFGEFVARVIDSVFADEPQIKIEKATQIQFSREIFLDIFSTRPLYLNADDNNVNRFKTRVVRQEFSGGKRYDLSAENSTALLISDNEESRLYSIASCLHAAGDSHEKFHNLFRMIHGQLSGAERKVERLAIPMPDIYNEFQLSAIRRAVRIYYNRLQTMPRSVAVLFDEMALGEHEKFRDGDFALIVDYIRGQASLTLVQAKFNAQIEKALPITRGIIWERHPTFSETCVPTGYEDFEEKLNDLLAKSGLTASQENLDRILDVFGVKGLPLEMSKLALEFSDGTWVNLTLDVLKILQQTQFAVTEIVKKYLRRMSDITGGAKVYTYVISQQLKFIGGGAKIKTGGGIPVQGMKFYSELQRRVEEYEKVSGEKLPPLWSDQLPELAIKRLYGVFELISANDANKVSPQFGIAQKIPVAQRFTLPKGKKEYRFGLILGESKTISYEAVVRHRAFPLAENVECDLKLTYTYGRDIPYELVFKPTKSQAFHEATVEWESAAEHQYKNLHAPVFPADTETWTSLQHIRTLKNPDSDALDWVENTFSKNHVVNFDDDDYSTDEYSWFVFVKSEVDGKPAIFKIHKDKLGLDRDDTEVSGTYSLTFDEDTKTQRYGIIFDDNVWRTDRYGNDYCYLYIGGREVAFYESAILFDDDSSDTIGRRSTFEILEKGKVKATNIIVEREPYTYYWVFSVTKGDSVYSLPNLAVMFPLHKIYANGRSSKTPGCPEHFRNCVEELAQDLPEEFIRVWNGKKWALCLKLLRIMCVMAADIGKPVYDFLRVALEQRPQLFDDDWGCALGDYDRAEQQQLLVQILSSKLTDLQKIFALNRAAWKSDGFIANVPARFLLQYFEAAIDIVSARKKYKDREILRALEFILAVFRLRNRGEDFLDKALSLNNKKVQQLYVELEDMIEQNYELPKSRLELKDVHQNSEYAASHISDFYYALLICITGEDEIKISGISEDEEN